MLRVLGDTPPHATDEPDDTGMDVPIEPQDAGRDTARPRSAPAFCRPKPVSPKPFQSPVAVEPPQEKAPEPPRKRETDPAPVTQESAPASRWRDTLARVRPASDSDLRSGAPLVATLPDPPMAATAALYEAPRPIRHVPEPIVPPRNEGEVRPLWDDASEEELDESGAVDRPAGPAWTALARGVALLLGTLLAVDLFAAGGLPAAGPWWLDTRPLPEAAAAALLGLSCTVLIAFAARPTLPQPVRTVAMICVGLLIVVALKNATVYYGQLKRGDLHAGPPVAFPLHVAACLGVVLLAMRSASGPTGFRGTLLVLVGFNAALVTLPIAQIACSGPIDARRPATAAVVFGPRSFEKHPEDRIDDRVRTAAALHKTGTVAKLLFAGGPSGDRLERMTRLAAEAGVPPSVIEVLPDAGDPATFRLLGERFPEDEGVRPTLLAVSDFDHLPRVVLTARHAGLTLSPVPAATTAEPSRTVLLRETVELWRCYFRR